MTDLTTAGSVELASPRGRVVLSTVVLGSAVAMLTATVVNVALPTIAVDLEASSAGQTWIVNGYALTLASFVLIGGALGEHPLHSDGAIHRVDGPGKLDQRSVTHELDYATLVGRHLGRENIPAQGLERRQGANLVHAHEA